jgi:hypothetical protein
MAVEAALLAIAMIPCTGNISKCPPQQWAQVQAYSPQFMDQFLANIHPDSHNGAFLDACLIHGSTSTPIDGLTNAQAFQSWLAGNATYGCVICSPTPAPFGVRPVPHTLPIPPPPTHPTHHPLALLQLVQQLVGTKMRRIHPHWALRHREELPGIPALIQEKRRYVAKMSAHVQR